MSSWLHLWKNSWACHFRIALLVKVWPRKEVMKTTSMKEQCNQDFYRSLNKSYSRWTEQSDWCSLYSGGLLICHEAVAQAQNWVQVGVKRKPVLHIPNSISWPSSSCPFSASSIASSWSSRAVSAYLSRNSSSVSSCSSSDSSVSDSCQIVPELCQHSLFRQPMLLREPDVWTWQEGIIAYKHAFHHPT